MNEFIQRVNDQLSLPCDETDTATVESFLEEALLRLEYLQKALADIGREDILKDCEAICG